ncbi:MAG TPA: MlaD family protein [Acidobacteriota bacterium]|nr:MlaD family protein [Acidobacteriota bacterium]
MSRAVRLGAFIVATLAVLAAGVFIIGNRRYLFSSTYRLKAEFDNAAGLDPGADVRVAGVHRGTVRSIDLPPRPGEKIVVAMDLDASTQDIIKKDSLASVETEGLIGDKYVAVSFGSAEADKVQDGDTIRGQPTLEISSLIKKTSEFLESGQKTMKNVTQATSGVGGMVAEAKEGATSFNENMEALKHNFFLRGFFKKRGYEDSAELTKYEITRLPRNAPLKNFTFPAKQLFDKPDTAKLKNEKSLKPAGDYLADNKTGLAVVVGYTGMAGDTERNLVLSEARAMVIRNYLAENFQLDDTRLKTLGMGEKSGASSKDDWGAIEIIVYPTGTPMPPAKQPEEKLKKAAKK